MESSPVIQLVPYIVALSTGFITICSTVFLYIRHRGKVFLYFSLLSFAMLSKLLHLIIKLYFAGFPPGNGYVIIILKIAKAVGISLLFYVLPVLINHVMLVKTDLPKKIIFAFLSVSALIIYFIDILTESGFSHHYVITNSFFVLIALYCIGTVIFNFKRISDKRLKIIISTFFILAIIFFPLLLSDIINMGTTVQLPAFFIIINILSVIFCLFYLSPPSHKEEIKPEGYFQDKYRITRREKEIIDLIITGCSNKEISDQMHISISTVEKHIYSIYQKLNINNRVQLINLIQSGL
ncbi:MAG: helix-turn-helix transcriptional regulator [Spirochaetes bacterium]|nr:helix-turn-helix transcriptional regulator [Spirochaetota bacterium]